MTLPLCTVCESPDVVAVEPVPAHPVAVELIFAVTGQRATASRAWCAACWPWRPERVAGHAQT